MTFTDEDYEEAILFLQAARTQLVPDGRNCACCGDNDHQAFECDHNPLVQMVRAETRKDILLRAHEVLHEEAARLMGGS